MVVDQEVLEECERRQEDEVLALESIYGDAIHVLPNPSNKPGRLLSLTVPITLASPASVILCTLAGEQSASHPLEISHLPSLSLRVLLPSAYPVREAPRPILCKAGLPSHADQHAAWLSRRVCNTVAERMAGWWKEDAAGGEGMEVLFRWWEWVASGDFLSDLGLLSDGQLRLTVPPLLPPSTFHTLLKSYNAQQLHSAFQSTAYACSICFENRSGKSCLRLPCECIFCTPCLHACWSLAIGEGTLESVSCPSPSCVKTRATSSAAAQRDEMDPELVRSVVGEELYDRWQDLKEKRRAEIDPEFTICPRPSCQAAVPPPPEPLQTDLEAQAAISRRAIRLSDIAKAPTIGTKGTTAQREPPSAIAGASEDRWVRYRQCPRCSFSFCLYCGSGWHGVHIPCAFPKTSEIALEYLSYPEGSAERARIEQRRGKANLEKIVARYLEDEQNRQWLESSTRACAGCGVRVEKSHGCNHMTCGRCHAHFCYRCGESVSPTDPYAHYRNPAKACFEKLFDLEEIQRFDREMRGQPEGFANMIGDEWGPRGVWEW